MGEVATTQLPERESAHLRLQNGSRVAVIGGGPAGSFFGYFVLQMAERVGMKIDVDIYEPRDFKRPGPGSCNMCGGIISESLVQHLAAEGIRLPASIIQRRIDSYVLHTDAGTVRILTPLHEKRIAAVHRGAGPRTFKALNQNSLDGFLLDMAANKGASVVRNRVKALKWCDGRPQLESQRGLPATYDFVAAAVGVNNAAHKLLEETGLTYKPPTTTKAFICEYQLGEYMVKRYLGSSMHIFLLDLPRLEFAAVIPKSDYATICLLGQDIDPTLVEAFMSTPELKQCMPPDWKPSDPCHCSPRISVQGAVEPFADRLVFVGDCGTTRLYKDGIGAAYRTAKAAAVTAVFRGIAARDFRQHYLPTCQKIEKDNRIGKFIFGVTRQVQKRRIVRRAIWRMVSKEQSNPSSPRRMSSVLWDIFTGSAPYKSVLKRSMHPGFVTNLFWEMTTGARPTSKPKGRIRMATGATGVLGKQVNDGEIIYRQGDRGDCMYVILDGQVQVLQRKGDKEYCLAVLDSGDFFGEMALFEEELRSTTVRAVGQVSVYTLERTSLLRRVHEDPSLAFRIIEKMSHRIRELEQALVRKAEAAN
jgi:flavin-dependent dehydrogenase